jgi:hypothetical protein
MPFKRHKRHFPAAIARWSITPPHPTPRTMSNPYRTMIAQLAAALQQQVFRDPEMDGNDLPRQARALLDQPELPELTDEALTMTYAYAVAAAVGNRRGPYKLEDAEAAQLAGLRAAIAADRARRIP